MSTCTVPPVHVSRDPPQRVEHNISYANGPPHTCILIHLIKMMSWPPSARDDGGWQVGGPLHTCPCPPYLVEENAELNVYSNDNAVQKARDDPSPVCFFLRQQFSSHKILATTISCCRIGRSHICSSRSSSSSSSTGKIKLTKRSDSCHLGKKVNLL